MARERRAACEARRINASFSIYICPKMAENARETLKKMGLKLACNWQRIGRAANRKRREHEMRFREACSGGKPAVAIVEAGKSIELPLKP